MILPQKQSKKSRQHKASYKESFDDNKYAYNMKNRSS